MKKVVLLLISLICFQLAFSQNHLPSVPDSTKKLELLDVSCGKCKFGLAGKSCELAVRIAGKVYYVVGAGIDDFGDAHGKDGFCNAVRKAQVQGRIEGDKFVVTYIKLLPVRKNKNT